MKFILLFLFAALIVALMLVSPVLSRAAFQLAPDCDPSLPPSHENACNISAAIKWLQRLIRDVVTVIAIPLATIMIIYGGFVIMTAGGSDEKLKRGKSIIISAVIGIVISLGSYIIITTIKAILTGNLTL